MRSWRWRGDTGARRTALGAALLAAAQITSAYTLDVNSTDSLKSVAKSMAEDMMSYYNGDQPGGVPGLLPQPYYWWEAGALMGALVDYWYYTGDTTFNNVTQEGLLFQVGPNNDYMPPNQTMTEGNDDQGFWGMAVMSAAEYNFPNPPKDKPQWLALAQAVFNTQAFRWDAADCGGGLRWQIFTWNNGYTYKNSISQACFFNIGARLALYTGNQSYADWADKTWDWMVQANLLKTDSWYIYDGTHIDNCSDITPYQWTYNAGAFLLGAAAMYNYTTGATQEMWKERVDGLLNGTMVFFTGNNSDIMTEVACESVDLCDLDQQSFKAYLSRWMAATTKWAPWTFDRIKPLMESSATAAASQCTGGDNGRMCGLKWTNNGQWDGSTGVGQQMAAMEIVLANMIHQVTAPVTNTTGGTSVGDPGAGGQDVGRTDPFSILDEYPPITTGDKAGAYIATIVVLLSLVSAVVFVLLDEKDDRPFSEKLSEAFGGGGGAAMLRKHQHANKGKAMERTDSDHSMSDGRASGDHVQEKNAAVTTRYEHSAMAVPMNAAYVRQHRATRSEVTPRPYPAVQEYWAPRADAYPEQMAAADQRLSYPGAGRRKNSLRKKAAHNRAAISQRSDQYS